LSSTVIDILNNNSLKISTGLKSAGVYVCVHVSVHSSIPLADCKGSVGRRASFYFTCLYFTKS